MRRAIDDTAPAPLTLGAVRARLIANGYSPVSALLPHGWALGQAPGVFIEAVPAHVISEHPPAVLCAGGSRALVALILQPIEDAQLAERVRAVLHRAGLIRGPVRQGSDGSALWLMRSSYPPHRQSELNGAFTFESLFRDGPYKVVSPSVIPLDGHWPQGTLLEVPYGKLPEIDNSAVEKNSAVAALLKEIGGLPSLMREEARPKPKPSPFAWIGRQG